MVCTLRVYKLDEQTQRVMLSECGDPAAAIVPVDSLDGVYVQRCEHHLED